MPMTDPGTVTALTEEQRAALWAEHDRLRKEIEQLQVEFGRVNDQLMEDLKARTGFPRGSTYLGTEEK